MGEIMFVCFYIKKKKDFGKVHNIVSLNLQDFKTTLKCLPGFLKPTSKIVLNVFIQLSFKLWLYFINVL